MHPMQAYGIVEMAIGYGAEREISERRIVHSKAIDPSSLEQEHYAMAYQRAGNACEICGVRGQNVHHRKARGMGGANQNVGPENLLVLCGSGTTGCHGWIERNREMARQQGWLLGNGEMPYKVPVAYRGHWHLLTQDGLALPVSPLDLLDLGRPMRLP